MSLEIALQENTAASIALVEQFQRLFLQLQTNTIAGTTTPEVIANAKVADPEPKPKAETKAKAEPKAPKAPVVADVEALTYADIAPLIVAIAKEKGREVAIELMTTFGAKGGKDLKPEQYAEFKAKADAILAGEVEDELV